MQEHRFLEVDVGLHVAEPLLLVAMKVDAFLDRGVEDPVVSKDLEDILTLLCNQFSLRSKIVENTEMASHIRSFLVGYLKDSDGLEIIQSLLPGDEPTQALGHELHQWIKTLK